MPKKSSKVAGDADRADASRLSDWPRLMAEPRAAAYLDISVGTFRQHIRPHVPPIQVSPGRIGYDRKALDAWVDRQSGMASASEPVNPWHVPSASQIDKPAAVQLDDGRPARRFSTDVWSEEFGVWCRPPPRLYPVSKLERRLLAHLSDGSSGRLPKGVSIGTVDRLEDRGWIEHVEEHEDHRRDTYVLTEAGLAEARSSDGATAAPDA